MKYVIYSAIIKGITSFKITSNPYIDFTFLHNAYGVKRLEVLTQPLGISYINYIMRKRSRNHGIAPKFIFRDIKKADNVKIEVIKQAMKELGLKLIKKSKVIDYGDELPGNDDLETILILLKGKILSYHELKKMVEKGNYYIENELSSILQVLYLNHSIVIYPSCGIENLGTRYICKNCDNIVTGEIPAGGRACPNCGSYLEIEGLLFAAPNNDKSMIRIPVKFKDYKGFAFPQDMASNGLMDFIQDDSSECLLWMVSGSENINITARAIRSSLNKRGKCVLITSGNSQSEEFYTNIKNVFPGASIIMNDKSQPSYGADIVICGPNEIRSYYKNFDLVIAYESPGNQKMNISKFTPQIRRALRDEGKIIYSTATPEYKIYKRAIKGEIKFVTVPIRNHGRPCPEPRILTYKIQSGNEYFIHSDIINFVLWSVSESIIVHIIVPYLEQIKIIHDKLLDHDSIRDEWFQGSKPFVIITNSYDKYINLVDEENVIVFFADEESVFDEKELLDVAGLAGKLPLHKMVEVIFVGSKESEEMYNAKLMLRHLNRLAWEMGYVK